MENNNSFWQTESGKATIKFGGWFVFIIVIFIIFAIPGRNNEEKKVTEEPKKDSEKYTFKEYDEMQDELLNSNYSYKYDLKVNDLNYYFNGTKCNGEDIGYKESNEGIIKYQIKDSIVDENLYNNLEKSFLDLNVLFSNLKEYLYSVEKNNDIRRIKYNKEGYQVTVTTNLEKITNIEIIADGNIYNLSFTNAIFCDNITK